jgi:hypothetical protein
MGRFDYTYCNDLDKALKVAKKLNKEINAIQIFITTVNEELDTKDKTPAVKNSDSTLSYITVSIAIFQLYRVLLE